MIKNETEAPSAGTGGNAVPGPGHPGAGALETRRPHGPGQRIRASLPAVRFPSGAERLASASGEPYRLDEEGKPREIVGVIQEVTIPRRSDRAARESERRIRHLLGNAAEVVVIVAPGGALIDVNPAACRLLGYRRQQLLGKPVAHLFPADRPELLENALAELHRAPENAYCAEWELVTSRALDWCASSLGQSVPLR